LWKTILDGKDWRGEFQNKKKDGSLFWESVAISPILNEKSEITHFIAIKEDITESKRLQKESLKAKEKAEESDRLKSAFLANMSHEIRTPMNGILGFTELLKEPKLSGEVQQEYIDIIEKSGARMLNIINDIISISKVEAGEVEISLSETNVNEQIEYLHTFFSPEVKQKGIQIRFNNALNSKEASIKTDCEKMYAILTNLVKNAIKFTDEGSVEFGYVKKGNFLEFYVKDSGMGISKYEQKFIFERFRQANESLSRNKAGSGLGLAISKAYIEMLGGEIWVESELGKGSTFYFTIPYIKEQDVQKTIKVDVPINKIHTPIKKLKILIVEDDEISKLLMTIAVKKFAKEILKVSTGFDAIETCRNNPDIDLVMMDINMPEMDGYEATGKIRKFNKDLIVIAQTANGLSTDRDNAINAGCTDYISKPVNIMALTELIEKYF
jgi:signal transduction histidine kinase/CheY-like chemotaxis protein